MKWTEFKRQVDDAIKALDLEPDVDIFEIDFVHLDGPVMVSHFPSETDMIVIENCQEGERVTEEWEEEYDG